LWLIIIQSSFQINFSVLLQFKLEKALVGRKPPPGACNATVMLIACLHACRQPVLCPPPSISDREHRDTR